MLPETELQEATHPAIFASPDRVRSNFYSTRSIVAAAFASLLYLTISYFLIGFRTDQVFLIALFNGCYFASSSTRRFILAFSIFIVYWIVFDYMKAFPNYQYNTVHIASLYNAEKSLFGIHWHHLFLTPNEFFSRNAQTSLDIAAGLFYLCWIPVPLAFAAAMFFKNRKAFFQFSLTFFLVNLIGFIGYYLYPAAPPWYVAQKGFTFFPTTPGNTAALGRFDQYFGVSIFKSIYAKSSNVFAAMPSLHASYMMIVLFYGLKFKLRYWNIVFAIIMIGIWFAAVYSSHHYLLDVFAGMFCAVLGISLFQIWLKTGVGQKSMRYLIAITAKKR